MPYAEAEAKTEIRVIAPFRIIRPPWTLIGMIIMGTTMIASSTYVR